MLLYIPHKHEYCLSEIRDNTVSVNSCGIQNGDDQLDESIATSWLHHTGYSMAILYKPRI